MKKTLEPYQLIERSIIKKYRKELWTPFIVAVKRYELVQAGDRIAVCISGGKDSMLLAKLMQELHRHSNVPFDLVFLVMDPGYGGIYAGDPGALREGLVQKGPERTGARRDLTEEKSDLAHGKTTAMG